MPEPNETLLDCRDPEDASPVSENAFSASALADMQARLTQSLFITAILAALVIATCVLTALRASYSAMVVSPTLGQVSQTDNRDLDASPDVKLLTSGGWLNSEGIWSKYGVLGSAFDGKSVVLSTGESKFGSLGCSLSLHKRPIRGICWETRLTSGHGKTGSKRCVWEIAISAMSANSLRGFRTIETSQSDAACNESYSPEPASLTFIRP